ncbi:gliding motility-associated C-terminal domain-containing protein [Persicitalea sp.]|uniref:gliding motility-associated C-terminal domain-containing protein n=1 Tax=Persicitalea sp. TaxID=3100273 RepID=UPI00359333FA
MERGSALYDLARILLLFSMLMLAGDLRAQCPATTPPGVRMVFCGTGVVKLVFYEKQPVTYDSHWVSWGDGSIEQLFSRLKAVSHTYATIGPRKITVWGTIDSKICKSNDEVLDYNPGASTTAKSAITEFKMLDLASGELTIKNPSTVELLLYRKSGSGNWESTGRTVSKDNQQLKVFVDSLAATCFQLQSTDTCLAESTKSDPICSGILKLNGLEKSNELRWKAILLSPGAKVSIKKDNILWREVTTQGDIGSLEDSVLSCGREHCYQLFIGNQGSSFTSLPLCRRTPASVCGAEAPLFVPDAFSPNGDGINDLFEIKGEVAADYDLTVFSSWGTIIFHSQSITQSWDGKMNGTPLPPGIYVYKIRTGADGVSVVKSGSVLVLE